MMMTDFPYYQYVILHFHLFTPFTVLRTFWLQTCNVVTHKSYLLGFKQQAGKKLNG